MCGILYVNNYRKKDASATAISLFTEQIHRGVQGFGYYLPQKDKLVHNVKCGRTLNLLEREQASEILFHHRNPTQTSTIVSRRGCHPYTTKQFFDSEYIMIHNGRINNASERKSEHEKRGIAYVSEYKDRFNDSESLLWDLALYLEGEQKTIPAYGDVAFILIEMKNKKPQAVYFGRNNGRPLTMSLHETGIYLSSEGLPTEVEANKLYALDYKTKLIQSSPMILPQYRPYTPAQRSFNDWTPPAYSYAPYGWTGYSYDYNGDPEYYLNKTQISRGEYISKMSDAILENLISSAEQPEAGLQEIRELQDETRDRLAKNDPRENWRKPKYQLYLEALSIAESMLEFYVEEDRKQLREVGLAL